AQITGGFAIGSDMPLTDTRSRLDPLVSRVDDLGQIVIGQHFLGQITASARDPRVDPLAHAVSCCARNRPKAVPEEFGATAVTQAWRPSRINLLRRPRTWS